jgi:hypothetical protein
MCCAVLRIAPAGSTYFDSLQQEASFITTTNDPAGRPGQQAGDWQGLV